MKSLRDYLAQAQEWIDEPQVGDVIGIEIAPDHLIETVVMATTEDGVVILTDEHFEGLLESRGWLNESIGTYGAVGYGGAGQTFFEKDHAAQESCDSDAMIEAEYQGRDVPLGKPMKGDVKKSKVYVRGPKGNVVKVNFGDKSMRIKKSNPQRRKSFRARHNCANPGPRHKARYWSCRMW